MFGCPCTQGAEVIAAGQGEVLGKHHIQQAMADNGPGSQELRLKRRPGLVLQIDEWAERDAESGKEALGVDHKEGIEEDIGLGLRTVERVAGGACAVVVNCLEVAED